MHRRKLFISALLSALLVGLAGCGGEEGYTPVDFSRTREAAPAQTPSGDKGADPLRVAVSAMISPQETVRYYYDLLQYLGHKTGRQIQLIQRKTYQEINLLFGAGGIDLAFICSGPYASGRAQYGFEAIATPVVRGSPFYQAYLIVHRNRPFQRLEDLKGHTFAFTDPQSNTGALVPRFWLAQLGETPESFFRQVNTTFSHDNAILAVARGLVDGASVDGHKWEYYSRRNPVHTEMTRVIRKSEPMGSPPLVAATHLEAELKEAIRHHLLDMHLDARGRELLDRLMIEQFTTPREEWYQPVREMFTAVGRRPGVKADVAPDT